LLAALSRCAALVSVATALGELRDARATPALIGLLDVDDAVTRRAAAHALGQIQDPRAVDALLQASSDREHSVRAAALDALAAFGPAVALFGAVGLMRVLEGEGWTHTGVSAPRQSTLAPPVGARAPETRPAITGAARPGRRRRPRPLSMLAGWIPDVRRRVSG
jgi:HEAT repeat protein